MVQPPASRLAGRLTANVGLGGVMSARPPPGCYPGKPPYPVSIKFYDEVRVLTSTVRKAKLGCDEELPLSCCSTSSLKSWRAPPTGHRSRPLRLGKGYGRQRLGRRSISVGRRTLSFLPFFEQDALDQPHELLTRLGVVKEALVAAHEQLDAQFAILRRCR